MCEPTVVSSEQMRNVCKIGQKEITCSYLGVAGAGLVCLKHTSFGKILSRKSEEKSMTALGDNCSGFPNFTPTDSPTESPRTEVIG